MANINPTRINLINTKKNIRIAQKGRELLKRKREVLVIEFMKLLKLSGADRSYLDRMLEKAYKTIAISSAYVGDFELNYAAMHAEDNADIGIKVKNIMGVRVPEIGIAELPDTKNIRYYSTVGSSAAIDDIEYSFSEVKRTIVEIVKREQGLKRLVLEIDKTKRRVNALEYVMVPRLQYQSKYIMMRLEEMERDTFSALKHVKKRLQKK
jgi:V/A-type H+-transporting ATPase subunit D